MEMTRNDALMHSSPIVSVCIANYNGEPMLSECIQSVLAQDCNAAIEIIVHDDASTDGSLALVRERFPQVQLLVSDLNVGFCTSNNRMVAHARGNCILLLNNDAVLFPDAIATFLDSIAAEREGAVLSLPQYDYRTGSLVDRGELLDPFYTPTPNTDPKRTDVAYVIGACLFLQRSLWISLGGFPESFESIAEDMYLCCVTRLRGLPVRCLTRSGYRHRQGASFGGNRTTERGLESRHRRRLLSERNRIAVLVSCTPGVFVWPWLTLHIIALVAEGLLLSALQGTTKPWRLIYSRALHDTWHKRRALMVLRRKVQDRRRTGLATYLRGFTLLPRKLVLFFRHGTPRLQD